VRTPSIPRSNVPRRAQKLLKVENEKVCRKFWVSWKNRSSKTPYKPANSIKCERLNSSASAARASSKKSTATTSASKTCATKSTNPSNRGRLKTHDPSSALRLSSAFFYSIHREPSLSPLVSVQTFPHRHPCGWWQGSLRAFILPHPRRSSAGIHPESKDVPMP